VTGGYVTLEAGNPALVRAPLMRRFLAFLIDGVILFALAQVEFAAFWGEILALHRHIPVGLLLANAAIGMFYAVAPVVIWGGTPGKLVMGIYIATESGSYLSVWQAALRYMAISGFFVTSVARESSLAGSVPLYIDLLWFGATLIMLVADQNGHRALHDRIAGTRVLRGRLPNRSGLQLNGAP
jgi:uncharacterized RDD family membrane protein YckC